MLSDLVQYFTDYEKNNNNHISNISNNNCEEQEDEMSYVSITSFLRYCYKNTLNKEYKEMISKMVLNETKKLEIEDFSIFFGDYFYSSNYHIIDLFENYQLENPVLNLLFSTIDKNVFISYEEHSLEELFSSNEYDIEEQENTDFEISKEIEMRNMFNIWENLDYKYDYDNHIAETIKEFSTCLTNSENEIDDYFKSTMSFTYGYIEFTPKIQKYILKKVLENSDNNIKRMLSELKIDVFKDRFYICAMLSSEDDFTNYQINFDVVYKGLNEIKQHLMKDDDFLSNRLKDFSDDKRTLREINKLNNKLIEDGNYIMHSILRDISFENKIINTIRNLKKPVKGDVIF